ncbi:MAG TPA: FKBP-type peptidyl-prolyl cis-trans isomerase N-terminal domain-containing protein [Rhabdochlamydiaceae bacterium]|jgi:peptidylprolyl isomerase|nr:FKBP-type peptidyl-prolyl cis-trans isomerase N-terminal domain-containing protein [Rhabdochlamydiaceae bacterium]
MNRTIIALLCLVSSFAFAEETVVPPVAEAQAPAVELPEASTAQKVLEASEAFGVLMAKSIQTFGINYDTDKVVQGFKDGLQGKGKFKSEMECAEIMFHAQEAVFKELAAANLKKTEAFLDQNKSAEGIKELEANKLQYKIEKEGTGPVVDENSTPIIRYTAKFLDESVEEPAKDESRINIKEDEMIVGFKKALIGMKEGEKRIVYIHPDLAFTTKEYNQHTNSLLTYEIEVVKADAPAEQPIETAPNTPKINPEVAFPFDDTKVVR